MTGRTDHLTGTDGKATFRNLTVGYYKIEEFKVPDGYAITGNKAFFIHVVDNDTIALVEWDGTEWKDRTLGNSEKFRFEVTVASGNNKTIGKATIGNTPGVALPNTGGPGTNLYVLIGSTLLALAGGLLLLKKRKVM